MVGNVCIFTLVVSSGCPLKTQAVPPVAPQIQREHYSKASLVFWEHRIMIQTPIPMKLGRLRCYILHFIVRCVFSWGGRSGQLAGQSSTPLRRSRAMVTDFYCKIIGFCFDFPLIHCPTFTWIGVCICSDDSSENFFFYTHMHLALKCDLECPKLWLFFSLLGFKLSPGLFFSHSEVPPPEWSDL